ncbi:MAG: hypothetical protein P4L84_20580 [Isosphaeraceae bacterium]|nr:hypothetical protein [Isosphaeraceae bacterium]
MPRGPSRYHSLRNARVILGRMAPVVRFAIFSVGVSLFLDQARPLLSDSQFTWGERRVMGVVALVTFASFGLAAWVAGHLLRTAAELIDVVVDGVEANERTADLIERHMVPALNRLASALERAPADADANRSANAASVARRAIEAGRWGQADRLVEAFARDFPGLPERTRLSDELAEARRGAVDELHRRVDAARAAGDGESAIDARDALTEHLRGPALADLDQDLVHWLYGLIQARARGGAVSAELAALASRAADSFGDTTEGASLRSALPKLRRSAGLCPRCARPYRGAAPSCPRCLAASSSPSSESEVHS